MAARAAAAVAVTAVAVAAAAVAHQAAVAAAVAAADRRAVVDIVADNSTAKHTRICLFRTLLLNFNTV